MVPTAQQLSLSRIGRVFSSTFPVKAGVKEIYSRSRPRSGDDGRKQNTSISAISTTRAMRVARAAPRTPMAGAPSSPKMNTWFRAMFTSTAPALMIIGGQAFPTLRIAPASRKDTLVKA